SDYYTEQLVKRKTPALANMGKIGLICLTAFSCYLVFMVPVAVILPVIMVVVDVFFFKRMDVEYEYLFVNGDLDIDKIMSKAKRKRVFAFNVNEMEILAPSGSAEMRLYQNIKPSDYSSQVPGHATYEMVVLKNGSKFRIIFEPNQVILDGMRMMAPRKVVL
ncbi:MAG: DUF6106 family protein, partial [Lachnospiraceae bacterium]